MNSWHIPGRYDFSVPEAQRLADLSGIDSDLEAVVRICARCGRLMEDLAKRPESDGVALWDDMQALGDLMFAAVVRYGRSFASGARQGIPSDWIALLPATLQETHSYFKALRDKYVAHSVNQLEDNQVFVMLTPQFAEQQEPTRITVESGRLIALGQADLQCLASLVEALRKMVADEVESETSKLLTIARQLPLEEIISRGTESGPIPGKAETFKVRSKF